MAIVLAVRGVTGSYAAAGAGAAAYLIMVADERGAVVVRHGNREGRVQEYDFSRLPAAGPMQASLAALFAARCMPGRWAAHATSAGAWLLLRQFAEFLARQQRPPRDLDELTPPLVRQWRESLPAGAGGYRAWRSVSGLLRDDARLQAGAGRRRAGPPQAPRARSSPTPRRSSTSSPRGHAAGCGPRCGASATTRCTCSGGGKGRSPRASGTGPSAKGWTSWPARVTCPGTPARDASRRSTSARSAASPAPRPGSGCS